MSLNNDNNDNNNERMSSIIIDIEAQSEIKKESNSDDNSLKIPLKGILKKSDESIKDEELIQIRVIKLCFSILIIILIFPISICDLYFGFTNNKCSRQHPDGLEISLSIYLLVSAFIGFLGLIMFLISIWSLPLNNKVQEDYCLICCYNINLSIMSCFNTTWNIIGAIVFWGYIYKNGNCDEKFSTYLFVTLILKFVMTFVMIHLNKNNK